MGLSIVYPRCEWMINPLGINVKAPKFSWEIQATERCSKQQAYRIIIAHQEADLRTEKNLVWDSGKIDSEVSSGCEYQGAPLQSKQRYYWKVKIWDVSGKESQWSDTGSFEMALLEKKNEHFNSTWDFGSQFPNNCFRLILPETQIETQFILT